MHAWKTLIKLNIVMMKLFTFFNDFAIALTLEQIGASIRKREVPLTRHLWNRFQVLTFFQCSRK